jgi:hypothetical protein
MTRLIIVALLSLIIGVAIGYAFAHQSHKRLHDKSTLTLYLHRDIEIASITGKELSYLQDQQDSKAAHFMLLNFCGAVQHANGLISQGAKPFPIYIDPAAFKQGRDIVKLHESEKCVASVNTLLDSIPKLQSELPPNKPSH